MFQRVLARIGPSAGWVLKGGFCLEVRFDLASRATKDLDLVAATGWGEHGALDLQDEFDAVLAVDSEDDGFRFAVGMPRSVHVDSRETWRVPLEAIYDGRVFAQVRIDIVVQYGEVVGGVEELLVPAPSALSELAPARVLAVDVNQHAAEKIHAYSRIYAHDQPSSRVKDLVDLVLLIESGVLDPQRLWRRLVTVHTERDGVPPPSDLPAPPVAWQRDYADLLSEHALDVAATTATSAHQLLAAHYAATIAAAKGTSQ